MFDQFGSSNGFSRNGRRPMNFPGEGRRYDVLVSGHITITRDLGRPSTERNPYVVKYELINIKKKELKKKRCNKIVFGYDETFFPRQQVLYVVVIGVRRLLSQLN